MPSPNRPTGRSLWSKDKSQAVILRRSLIDPHSLVPTIGVGMLPGRTAAYFCMATSPWPKPPLRRERQGHAFRHRVRIAAPVKPAMSCKSTSTASCSTKKTPRSASTTTACSTATACSKACAATAARSFACKEHLDRLWDSAKAIWLEIPMTQGALGRRGQRHAAGQQHQRRLHPPGRHPRRRHARARSRTAPAIRR